MDKISEIFVGETRIKLSDGREAVLGALTFAHMLRIEKAYGSWEAFTKMLQQQTMTSVAEALWYLLNNPGAFKDQDDLFSVLPVTAETIVQLRLAITSLIVSSMPKQRPGAEGESAGKSTGGTSSQPSPGTTDTDSASSSS
jgi:hypothetical protein